MMNQMMTMDAEMEFKKRSRKPPYGFREAEVESGATAVVFTIPGLNTINSIARTHSYYHDHRISGTFRYSAPKLSRAPI